MGMNKIEFIRELSKHTGYDEKQCIEINNIIEDTVIIGKRNKNKMIENFKNKLNLKEDEANKVYETAMNILSLEIKNKLKHPFKN